MHLQRAFIICGLLILTPLFIACGGSTSGGDTGAVSYYVDATLGSDSDTGLTQTTAWRSLAKVASTTFNQPANIYLKRGDTWHESLILPSSDIAIDAYGSGALPKIDGSTQITAWVDEGGGIYSALVNVGAGQALGNLSENGNMLDFVAWDNDVATTFSTAPTGTYSYSYPANILYIKPSVDPALNTYSASLQIRGVYALAVSNIAVRNIEVTRISLHAIEFHDCANCTAENVTVSRSGGAVIGANFVPSPDFLYAGNGIDFSNSCIDASVANVTVSEIFDSCLAVELYESNSTASDIQLADAQLDRCGFAGVEISVLSNRGANTNSTIDSMAMSSIDVDRAGKGWSGRRYGTEGHGMRIIADNGAGSMANIRVDTSVVSDSAGDGFKLAGDVNALTLHRVRSTQNDGIGINVAAPSASSLHLKLSSSIIDANGGYGLAYNAPAAAGFTIYHTTFYDNTAINLAVLNQTGVADMRNNLFYSSAPMTHLFSAAALVNPTVNNNCYNDTSNMFGYNGSAYSSVADFETATGFESNGIGNGSVGLVDPANGNFGLMAGSSCLGLGDASVGISEDYSGADYSAPPASGAYQ